MEPLPSELSLLSLAHGAGRKWMRSECRAGCRGVSARRSWCAPAGGQVICQDRQLIYEEAPEAYKPVDSIVDTLVQAGLVRPLARLAPVLTYKTRGECC